MLQMFSRIAMALVVAGPFWMTAWAGENAPINRPPRPGVTVDFQENMPVNQLPGPVTAAIKKRFPKSELLLAERDVDNGRVIYEVKVRSNGQIFDLDITPGGKILKIDRDID